eukprot:TRINITY_DN8723_c0_g1_i2.p1 TRINITY_DN8723_c0_g1~~TRINITY_DN8723_c0_g1_i2.p1  ORF type:complete len:936 (+),score=89.65 TRINITY_DN8723_c0_g1_i2:272-3079(+)
MTEVRSAVGPHHWSLGDNLVSEVRSRTALVAIVESTAQQSFTESVSLGSRIHSSEKDWTTNFGSFSFQLVVPALAVLMAALIHRPELANARRSRKILEEEGGPSWAHSNSSFAPLSFLVGTVAIVSSQHLPWITAQVPLLFMILGYGLGSQNPPMPWDLFLTLVPSYAVCLWLSVLGSGIGPMNAVLFLAKMVFPVEALSSLPLTGFAQASACFGSALVCVAFSSGLFRICRGASASGIFYLWILASLGVLVDRDCPSMNRFVDPVVTSLPSRLQLPSFAAGMMVSSWGRPKGRTRILGLVLAFVYASCGRLPVSDASWHAVYRGVLLPVHVLILWSTIDLLSIPQCASIVTPSMIGSGFHAVFDTPVLPVSFAVLFALPMMAAEYPGVLVATGVRVSIVFVVVCAVCHLTEWAAWLSFKVTKADKPGGKRPHQVFLGAFFNETSVRNKLAFRLLQAGVYYFFFLGGLYWAVFVWEHRNPTFRVGIVRMYHVFSHTVYAVGWLTSIVTGAVVLRSLFGQLTAALTWRLRTLPAKELQDGVDEGLVVSFRYCTQGTNPTCVSKTVDKMYHVLQASGLKKETWRLEVVTDNALGLIDLCEKGVDVTEIVVPSSYTCPNGGKYEARALHYAALNSATKLRRHDWVCHVNEGTHFDIHTACAVYQHCQQENSLVAVGKKSHPDMGQGMILYNTFGPQAESLITALADTIRVSDGLGKFRLRIPGTSVGAVSRYGWFAVTNQGVEEAIGFDFGSAGSITEDSYFAMKAEKFGVGIQWIDAFMYEQSPLCVMDLIRQRARRFHGLFFCTSFGGGCFPYRATWLYSFMMATWTVCFLTFATNVLVHLTALASDIPDHGLLFVTDITTYFFKMNYMLGFVHSFSPYLDGWSVWLCLFFMQTTVLPVAIGIVEMCGVANGIYLLMVRQSALREERKEKVQSKRI